MSMLLASKDIYLSTQQSGAPGTNDQRFSRFRMSLNTTPLVCGTNEQTRLTVGGHVLGATHRWLRGPKPVL